MALTPFYKERIDHMPLVQPELEEIRVIVAAHLAPVSHADLMTELDTTGKSNLKPFVKTAKRAGVITGETIQAVDGEKPVLWYSAV